MSIPWRQSELRARIQWRTSSWYVLLLSSPSRGSPWQQLRTGQTSPSQNSLHSDRPSGNGAPPGPGIAQLRFITYKHLSVALFLYKQLEPLPGLPNWTNQHVHSRPHVNRISVWRVDFLYLVCLSWPSEDRSVQGRWLVAWSHCGGASFLKTWSSQSHLHGVQIQHYEILQHVHVWH